MKKFVIAMCLLAAGCLNVKKTSNDCQCCSKIDQMVDAMREVGAKEVSATPLDFESISVVKKNIEYNGKIYEVRGIVFSSERYCDRYPYFVVTLNNRRISPVEEIELILMNKIPYPEFNDRWGSVVKLVANPPSEDFSNAYLDWASIPNAKIETLNIAGKKVFHITNVESPMFVVVEKQQSDSTTYLVYSYNK